MKRLYRSIIVLLLVSLLPLNVFASTNNTNESIIYYDDGSYSIITITCIASRAASGRVAAKTETHYSSDGEPVWKVTLHATYTYDGVTSVCDTSSCRIEIINTNWYEISSSASKSGSTAYANATLGYKWLGIKISEKTVNLSLTCDKNGNISYT